MKRKPVTIGNMHEVPMNSQAFLDLEARARQLRVQNEFLLNAALRRQAGLDGANSVQAQKQTTSNALLDSKALAQYLGLQEKAVREMANRGAIPGVKVPPNSPKGQWRFRRADVEKALQRKTQRRQQVASEPSIWQ